MHRENSWKVSPVYSRQSLSAPLCAFCKQNRSSLCCPGIRQRSLWSYFQYRSPPVRFLCFLYAAILSPQNFSFVLFHIFLFPFPDLIASSLLFAYKYSACISPGWPFKTENSIGARCPDLLVSGIRQDILLGFFCNFYCNIITPPGP